ncbi:hypothetical protein L226DRAFT_339639 [Lentinus tigrinus ALCF2SS1-7]|uniref:uncharacterized protein n=1 Tax=Lentinus tigrinus ALCF2SS1-7 TaxID=1328758 RepID=UPI00116616B6|nr:hypothetical protein L226DRAFT_339639 [Lentinus tigrinus ALCF2SS1-7]
MAGRTGQDLCMWIPSSSFTSSCHLTVIDDQDSFYRPCPSSDRLGRTAPAMLRS